MLSKNVPVIVVGAGPAGCSLALYLAQHDVNTLLIETFTEANFLDQAPRTGSIHPSTLEMFADLGLYERIEPRGLIAPTFQFWDRLSDSMIAEFDHAVLKDDTRFPFVLQCERIKVAEEAMKMLRTYPNVKIRMGTTLEDMEQDADGVTAIVTNEGGETERIRGSFIISGEGARSVVRKASNIAFEGYTYPDQVLTVSVVHDFDKLHGYSYRNYLSDPDQWANLFKWGQPERWRVHFPTSLDDDPEMLLSDEYCQKQLQKFLPNSKPYDIVYRKLYSSHQLVADTFNVGRALLAGDSAHVNSPIGGVGMNSGVHDSINLGEKLVGILAGSMDMSVLDRYTRQRKHVAVNHVKTITERNKKLINERDPEVRKRNHDMLHDTAADPKLAREYILRTSLMKSLDEVAAIQ